MRIVGISLAAAGLASLGLSAVVAQAVLAPIHPGKTEIVTPVWNTTVTRD
jgi:hypothetical protein